MARRIEVDLGKQMVRAFEDARVVHECKCFTGDDMSPTHKGLFSVLRKEHPYTSKKYGRPMNYALFFTVDGKAIHQGVHVALRSIGMRTGINKIVPDDKLRIGSHGCVNVEESDARFLFTWASIGTQVHVE
jgi:hypothetical protein